jgi:alkaline phosphatase D
LISSKPQAHILGMRISCIILAAVLCGAGVGLPTHAQKNEKKKNTGKPYEKTQYKKHNRDQIADLAAGKVGPVISYFTQYLEAHPKDLESLYGLTLAYGLADQGGKADHTLQRALETGLDIGRFIAGPRTLTEALRKRPLFKEAARDLRLLHGPMLGDLRPDGCTVWLRTAKAAHIRIEVGKTGGNPVANFTGETRAEDDFTGTVRLHGLRPGASYTYRVFIDGQLADRRLPQRLQLPDDLNRKFHIVFGGGAGYTPWYERMWSTIDKHNPTALLLLGDNVYIDLPEVPEAQRYCYYRRQSQGPFRSLTAHTPVYAIWDDHDFGTNDCHGGPAINQPAWKPEVWKVFQENWPNPPYGGAGKHPGSYYTVQLGPVTFFMLDTRYYRTPGSSMLGPVQLAWFKEQVLASGATFKVICSSVPISAGTKGGSKDTWDGYPEERERILSWIAEEKINGVFVLAADRHRSDAWKTERPEGYPIYEFMSSRLTNVHTHPVIKASIFGYNKKCSFGKISFDFTRADPTVTYTIFSIDNEQIWEMSLGLKKDLSF